MRTRREFLKRCCTLGACATAAHLTRFGLMSAHAQNASSYKALVCIFLNGGWDANNIVVPLTTTGESGYNAYAAARGQLALAQNLLRPVAANNGATPYGLHPALQNLQALYNSRRAAIVLNVGTLVRPTTKQQYQQGSVPLPRNLYSHSDQIQQWQTANPTVAGGTGWGGRVTDVLSSAAPFPGGISVSGNAALLVGQATSGITIAPGSNFGLTTFGTTAAMNARVAALQQILTFDSGVQLIAASAGVLSRGIRSAQEINAAISGGTPLATPFPNTTLGNQLRQVAQIIQVRGALGMDRQIFFASLGGWDHHSNLLVEQNNLLTQVDAAIGAFQTALGEMNVEQNVTTFTESEFNRTMNANATAGSDHAWGGHHFVIGGAVRGGEAYGSLPNLALQGPDDVGSRGLWLPSLSLDQYAATLASWFGVPDNALTPGVFPNLANFAVRKLAFL
jgi:uncharacterized protein (DUF1501 family)